MKKTTIFHASNRSIHRAVDYGALSLTDDEKRRILDLGAEPDAAAPTSLRAESRDLADGVGHTLGFGPTALKKTVAEILMLSGNKAGSSPKRTATPISTPYYRRFTRGR
ncbi:hypothetical protein [Paraburkholderia sp. BCC1876]|uniref:hypothetical protein n=1 Tax=Paraburkholderia sp. BCC1876 TaxID=2676303 RepID=UPI0015903526|nr:hypothetical protein [Paraburkholderia sp. BCC1876]